MEEERIVYVYKSGLWQITPFEELKKGDRIRIDEPDGTPVVDTRGAVQWETDSDAYLNEENIWTVQIKD